MEKPRTLYCWECSGKLQGDHHVEKPVPKWSGDDIPRILHKSCSKKYDDEVKFGFSGNDVQVEMDDYGHVSPQSKLFEDQETDEYGSYGEEFV